MSDSNVSDAWAQKVLASVLGAIVSLGFIRGTIVERVLMFIGAVAGSYYGTDVVAGLLGMQDSKGLVGLLLGLYIMPVVAKGYEAIALVDAGALAKGLGERIKRAMGG